MQTKPGSNIFNKESVNIVENDFCSLVRQCLQMTWTNYNLPMSTFQRIPCIYQNYYNWLGFEQVIKSKGFL